MRRLVSIPIAALMSLLIVSTALASVCGNESKPQGKGQHATLWFNLASGKLVASEGLTARGTVPGGFVDVHLDFDGNGSFDCFIDDTFVMSEHKLGHIATGQLLEGLAINPAVHRGNNPGGGDSGVGFAATVGC
jgi:hypothetical protein